ncbi:SHOCT domain-containing protein [Mycobacterium aquaticum]|uniref:SHOCT domain-containing protein n=1 Tax=Mycobacterium aquaticum TaxID=1927124 RepID=A0A1X0BCH9_9MYCO|nr:SHOCT domain-containing protein [Mycobacterium aquaticum]ORA40004.1 hypothetical protein BST13_01190 [Mycobacterium aquaticum]
MGLLKTAARAAVASSVHGRVQRRQQQRWAAAIQPVAAEHAVPSAGPAAAPPPPAAATDDLLAALERLGNLRDSGVLTEAEFSAQKARLLG